jgi:two-component system CheB/CheR fusion protein
MVSSQVLAEDKLIQLAVSTPTVIDALPIAIYTTDAAGRITAYNQAAADFWGRAPALGDELWCGSYRLYWADGTPMPLDECPMAVTLKTGQPVRDVEAIVERQDGSRAIFMPYPTALKDEDGEVTGGINMLIDISERKQADHTRERLAAIVDSSDDAIISKNLNGVIQSWNKGAERIFGYTAQEAIGCHVSLLIPQDRLDEEPGIIGRIRQGERIDHYETIRQRKDGSQINVSLTVSPVKNAKGQVVGASKIARDITEKRRAEEARELLLHEIKHRVKNTLGTVQAIASQTFRESPVKERESFSSRLRALSGAHDLLTKQDWDKVSAHETVTQALAPFQENRAERITLDGPDAILNANQSLLLAMAVHELATNAVKYGALSNDNGKIRVAWKLEGGRLTFSWRESDGPPVTPPAHRGFGTTLIERALRQEQGTSCIKFDPAGIDCTLEMKLH